LWWVPEGAWSIERIAGLRREGLGSGVARVQKRVKEVNAGGLGGAFGGVVAAFGLFGVLVGITVGATVGGAVGVVGVVGVAENFAAALGGRDYAPLPRTRGWRTTAVRP
jgi:hypothetical protein